jgi:hypothetical protein
LRLAEAILQATLLPVDAGDHPGDDSSYDTDYQIPVAAECGA